MGIPRVLREVEFGLGEAQQTIKIERYEWKKPGSTAKTVIDKLNI